MSAQNRCSSLLGGHRSAQNRCSSLLEGHKGASNSLLQLASWCSKSPVQYHCSKSLFEDAGVCDACEGDPTKTPLVTALGASGRSKHRYLLHLAPLNIQKTAIDRTWRL